ncbi:MAG: ribosome small subunit-dependent GTPase A [Burkholderiales bacterium]
MKTATHKHAGAAPVKGRVVASFGRRYLVELADAAVLDCVTRGKRVDVACGDFVMARPSSPGEGVIEEIAPRASLLYRSDAHREKLIAANVTQIVIVAAALPAFHESLINRCLAAAEHGGMAALIVLNKSDLAQAAAALERLQLYRRLGYEVLALAAKHDIAPLRARLEHHTSVLVGQSGVGKSTIVNRLLPQAAARVGELSAARGSGRHTTTHARLYHLDATSHVIDSPGMQEFGLHHLSVAELAHAFVEFRPLLGRCRFRDCRHLREPDCAIAAACAAGEISARRLASYRELASEIERRRSK